MSNLNELQSINNEIEGFMSNKDYFNPKIINNLKKAKVLFLRLRSQSTASPIFKIRLKAI